MRVESGKEKGRKRVEGKREVERRQERKKRKRLISYDVQQYDLLCMTWLLRGYERV